MVRVLLIEDPTNASADMASTLRRGDGINYLGTVASERRALTLAEQLAPDVIVAPINLREWTCFGLARYLKLRRLGIDVVLLTPDSSEDELYEAVRAGASAYLSQRLPPDMLVDAIRRVGQGECLIDDAVLRCPAVAARVLREFRELNAAPSGAEHLLPPLSSREMAVLGLIALGWSNKQIALLLSISHQTVKNHITAILRKLVASDRSQAVVFAIQRGWIRVDPAAHVSRRAR